MTFLGGIELFGYCENTQGKGGPGDAGAMFRQMAVHEAEHGNDLMKRRKELVGNAARRVSRNDIYDVEAPDAASPRWNR